MKRALGLWLSLALALALALGAFAAAATRLWPLEVHLASRRLKLRAAGVSRVRLGGLMAYERDRCAAGAPCRCVALVHGMGDSAMTWDKLLLGRKAAPPPEGYRLVAVDLAGTDGSPEPSEPDGYGVPGQARALRAALESRCPSWTVAGNSLGGWISLRLALDWPQGVERLVLLNPAGVEDPTGTVEKTARLLGEPTGEALREFRKKAWHSVPAAPDRAWDAAARLIRSRRTDKTVAALRREDLLDGRLGAMKAPVVILWGESDRVVPLEVGRRLERLIPGSRLELIPRCGHLPQQECPGPVARELYAG